MGYNYSVLITVTNLIFIINLVLIGSVFFIIADLAAMVHTYKSKTLPPSYSKEDLNTAMEIVKSDRMTIYRAAKLYKIPKATLFKHVKGLRGVKSQMLGQPTALPFHEEKKIAECLKLMEIWVFGLSKKEVLETLAGMSMETKYPHHSEDEFLVIIFSCTLKECISEI